MKVVSHVRSATGMTVILVVKIVRLITGVNHPQVVQMQIFQGYQHRTLSGGCIGIFQLETESFKILMSSEDFQGKDESGYRPFWNLNGT